LIRAVIMGFQKRFLHPPRFLTNYLYSTGEPEPFVKPAGIREESICWLSGKEPLRAVPKPSGSCHWLLDGVEIARTPSPYEFVWALVRGKHTLHAFRAGRRSDFPSELDCGRLTAVAQGEGR
jgi:hypothetical protein